MIRASLVPLFIAALVVAGATRAAPPPGGPEADYELARVYSGMTGERLDPQRAFAHLRKAAGAGHTAAQVDLGFAYFNGSSAAPKDLAAAFAWFEKAAAGGAAKAQCMLGDFYRAGLGGVKQDDAKAFHWYQRTAVLDDRCAPRSQYELSAAYEAGRGVRRDRKAAMAWLRKSAEGGNPRAQAALGRAYERGDGVERDARLAVAWTRKSREGVAPHDDHDHTSLKCPPWMNPQLKARARCA